MKRCPECRRDYYDDTLLYCLDDGTRLLEGPATAPASDEPATVILSEPPASAGGTAPSESPTRPQILTTDQTAILPADISLPWSKRKLSSGKLTALIVAGIVLASVIGGGYLYLRHRNQSAGPSAPDNLKIQRLTGNGKVSRAAISPDGKFLAYVQSDGGQQSLWVKQIATNSNVQVIAPEVIEGYFGAIFTPDGSYIYFSGVSKDNPTATMYRVPTLGGSVSKIISNAWDSSVSPDGKQIVFERWDNDTTETSVLTVNADGTGERKIGSLTGHRYLTGAFSWSPDGKLIACGIGDDEKTVHFQTIAIMNVADGEFHELTDYKWDDINSVVWLPDMSGIIFSADDTGGGEGISKLWEISYPAGESRRLTQDLTDYSKITLTADGKTLVAVESENTSSLWVSPNADLNRAIQITTGKDRISRGIAWTPDKRIVYVSVASGNTEVWVMNSDGTNPKQLTNDARIKYTPVVSPDGRYVVYATSQGGGDLWRIDIDGSNPVLLTGKGADEGNPDISSDGKWIVYSAWTSGKQAVWRMPIEGGDPRQLTLFTSTEPNISPDGKFIACFLRNEKQIWRIAVVSFEGGEPLKTFDVPQTVNIDLTAKWTPDGRGITYIDNRGGRNLWLQSLDGGAAKQLTDFKQNGIYRREWTRDGKRVAIVRGESTNDVVMVTDFR